MCLGALLAQVCMGVARELRPPWKAGRTLPPQDGAGEGSWRKNAVVIGQLLGSRDVIGGLRG